MSLVGLNQANHATGPARPGELPTQKTGSVPSGVDQGVQRR